MYAKLVFKNARRSVKDYLIYLVTMTICVTLFYAFLSISSSYYQPDLGSQYNFTMLSDSMELAICAVTLLLLFLIRYVNGYMLRRRQKEFAIQSVMGMEQRTIGRLFFAETLIMGAVSVLLGIFLGMLCSQFITAMLLASYGKSYRFTWMLFPDTVFLTLCFFTASFLFIGIFNLRTIRKIKIIDMLSAERKNDPGLHKSHFMKILTVLYLLLLAAALFNGIKIKYFYFDPRLPLPVHFLFWGNIIAPSLGLIWPFAFLIFRSVRKKRPSVPAFIAGELLPVLLCAAAAAGVPGMRRGYLLSYDSGVMNQYLLFLIFHVLYLICSIIFLANTAIIAWKEKSPKHRYKGETLFLLGQITSKLASNTQTMILICITLVLAIFLFIAAPVLSGWSLGYLDSRSMYDVQIFSRYNNVYDKKYLPDDNYEFVTDFLVEKGIEASRDCTFSLYLPEKADFDNRIKLDFPIAAISLGDYNSIRNMLGYEPISLKEKEFTTQWKAIATDKERKEFLEENTEISTDSGTLKLAENAYYQEPMGETMYNSYTDVLYVLPDDVCRELLAVMRNRYIVTSKALSFSDAQELETLFSQMYDKAETAGPSNAIADSSAAGPFGGAEYGIRTSTQQISSTVANCFVLKASMIYGAVVLMVICLTVLSLQQLLDASRYRYRFFVLRSLGVEERDINRLILKQLGVWFGFPVLLAVLTAGILVFYFLQTVSAQVAAYIGASALAAQIAVTVGILTLLLICYFISTWILFRHSTGR